LINFIGLHTREAVVPKSVEYHHPATLLDCTLIIEIACPLQNIHLH